MITLDHALEAIGSLFNCERGAAAAGAAVTGALQLQLQLLSLHSESVGSSVDCAQ
jgi:hypothetical protein